MTTASQAYLMRIRRTVVGSAPFTMEFGYQKASQDKDLLRVVLEKTIPGYRGFADEYPEMAIVFEETAKEFGVHPEYTSQLNKKGRALMRKAFRAFGKALPAIMILDGIVTALNIATSSYERIQRLSHKAVFGKDSVFDDSSDFDRYVESNGFFSDSADTTAYDGIFTNDMDFGGEFDYGSSGETPWESSLREERARTRALQNAVRREEQKAKRGGGEVDRHRSSRAGDGKLGRGTYGGRASQRDPGGMARAGATC